MTAGAMLRAGRDDDADAIIALIAHCWAEYPGCVMDLDGENPELRALASHFADAGGALWVAEVRDEVVGMVAVKPGHAGPDGPVWELCRLYVAASERGTGVAAALMRRAEAHARQAGAAVLDLWSDTRFDRAHRFYERHGFVRAGGIRVLGDVSNSLEFGYAKPVRGRAVRRLDTAAAASAARALGRMLQACAAEAGAIGFVPPVPPDQALRVYRDAATAIAGGQRILLVAWSDGALAGSIMVDLAMPADQTHRASVEGLLVAPGEDADAIAAALLVAAEQAAARSLLTVQAKAGDRLDRWCRAQGWSIAGRLPAGVRRADGGLDDMMWFYKQV